MQTPAVEIPNPFTNPWPKHLFCTDTVAMDAHRKLIQSEAWQVGSKAAQAQFLRSILSASGGKLDDPQHTQAASLAFERLQGMNDFINIFTSLAEIPKAPTARKSADNLEPLN